MEEIICFLLVIQLFVFAGFVFLKDRPKEKESNPEFGKKLVHLKCSPNTKIRTPQRGVLIFSCAAGFERTARPLGGPPVVAEISVTELDARP